MRAVLRRSEGGRMPTVHLVASGGGHLALLTAVRWAFADYRRVWVVGEGRAEPLLREGERVHTLPRYDRHPLRGKLPQTVVVSLGLVLRERPAVVITTGAGSTVPFCFFARLRGAKLIFIETMARVTGPSASGRVLSRLASDVLVQWPEALSVYPGAKLCRPALLEAVPSGVPENGHGTFVAVGTHTQPFDRLLRVVDRAVGAGHLPQPVVAQVGSSSYRPRRCRTHTRISPEEVERAIHESQYVVCHAGSGLVSAALRAGRRPLVLPRLAVHGEHFNDHQTELAAKLSDLNMVVPLCDGIGPAELARANAPLPEFGTTYGPSVGEALREILHPALGTRRASAQPAGGSSPPAIAVVTHDSRTDLERCLGGQLSAAESLAVPLVVVDNASLDGSAELLRETAERHPALRLVEMGRNAGYAAAVNAAFATVSGADVLLVNPDIQLSGPEPVRELAAVLRKHPRLGVVGPRLVGERGERQPSARRLPSFLALLGSLPLAGRMPAAHRAYERYVEPSRAERIATVDWVLGAAMLIRRECYERVGGWDESFFLYVEDADFCRRCARAGFEVAYVPEVVLVHGYAKASDASRASMLTSRVRRHHIRSHARHFLREPGLLFGAGRRPVRPLP